MTAQKAVEIVARQLAAEAGYLGVLAADPRIRAEHRRILEEAERELAIAVQEIIESGTLGMVAGFPDGGAGLPDGVGSETNDEE